MKKLFVQLVLFCIVVVAGACQSKKELLLKSPSDSKVYSIKVEDATEIDLLRQQLRLDIIKAADSSVYFHAESAAMLKQLSEMGYGNPQMHFPDDVYMLYGKVVGKYTEEEIVRNGVSIINREKDHVIVYGTITKLKTLKALGYKFFVPEYEIRPREIEVVVNTQPDIQKIYNLGVDIFTTIKDSTGKGGFIIRGSAFDRQIDSIKKMNFPVTIIRPRI